jgi:glycosyltransferase involved in cell wall biosynthesis
MRISGFTMARNAHKLYYPIDAAIRSMLPIVDEVVVALGQGDEDDQTLQLIEAIGDKRIRIIHTVWDIEKFPRGMENAHQTDIAMKACTGDWLLYLQADEVLHEDDLEKIRDAGERFLNDTEVEGFLFRYRHFWGDYDHYHNSHGWYRHEIRMVRRHPEIHSWESAQSFRRIPGFDGVSYRQQEGTNMLKVVELDAWIYHYGWVRPPMLMKAKTKALATIHKGNDKVGEMEAARKFEFDYGPLQRLPLFKGSHPAVMKDWIEKFDWKKQLQYSGNPRKDRLPNKHEKFRYRLFTWLKTTFPFLVGLGDFRNYILLKK